MRAPRAEQDPLDRRVDTIRTDKRIDENRLPVLELGLDGIATFHEAHEAVPNVNALRWQRPEQDGQQVGAVRLVPGEPESVDNRICERGTQEGLAVIPTALMECERPHTHRRQIVAKPEPMQDAGRVRAHLDARTDLAERTRLLVHVHIEPGPVKRERSGEAADPATDDPHRKQITHVTNDTPRMVGILGAREAFAPCASVLSPERESRRLLH
jgi:hypothetical protein